MMNKNKPGTSHGWGFSVINFQFFDSFTFLYHIQCTLPESTQCWLQSLVFVLMRYISDDLIM